MKQIPVILFGAGGVGRALLRQVVASRQVVAGRNRMRFNLVAVVDSRSWVWAPAGLADDQLLALVAAKANGQSLGPERPANIAIVEHAAAAGLEGALVVDVTAEGGLEPLIDRALELDYGVVLANKKPLAGPWATAQRYYNNPRLRHESTVGGGQPVIATLRYLLDTNDPIFRIEGQMSGTLGYICGRLDEDVPFSQAVAEARAKGYTEPDPREDLGGLDVRRKIMILGRMAGWPLEESDIDIETLYPPTLASLPVESFMAEIAVMDGPIQERVAAARAAGALLRYTAALQSGTGGQRNIGSVGLKAINRDNPLANLKYISFQTALYNDQPMMIGGKGAGVEMTAAGVLGDMIGLIREW